MPGLMAQLGAVGRQPIEGQERDQGLQAGIALGLGFCAATLRSLYAYFSVLHGCQCVSKIANAMRLWCPIAVRQLK
ncbi:hypothetical protein [Nitrospirillum amazonense]|uniref:hypothetical protein n=1 Tax=Nitrospirillum amazonense TaxID=28077 RepID=UPI001FE9C3B2|nr:hypothetical protein [Nitrospirillum amazonense]